MKTELNPQLEHVAPLIEQIEGRKKVGTIDCTPTWCENLRNLVTLAAYGNIPAMAELERMAKIADAMPMLLEACDAALRDLHCGTKDQAAATLRAALAALPTKEKL